ncbi:hypothetical protein [Streptomyces collinus]|uniref:hypothetical protein n=1 Tax=Streptomyces collinus TaxID=42684 RepID=UPI00363CC33D
MASRLPVRVSVAFALWMVVCASGAGLIGLLLGGIAWAAVAASSAAFPAAVGGGLWIRRSLKNARAEENRLLREATDRGDALGTAEAVHRALFLYEAAVFPMVAGSVNADEQRARRGIAYRLSAHDSLPQQVRLLAAEALEVIDAGRDADAAGTAMRALGTAIIEYRYAQ